MDNKLNNIVSNLRNDCVSYFSAPVLLSHYSIDREVRDALFGNKNVRSILTDAELVRTAKTFFECNLNISEASKAGYMHRNTLVYRLERIEKAIGLDIRTFDDAMTFRIAVMVIAHMKDQSRTE